MTTAQKIGFIGLGIMGAPMAGHLLKAGHTVFVHTRSKVPAAVAEAGAKACASGKAVAEAADIVITMVPDTPDVEAVLFGEDGVAAGLSKGKIVVDMSSISPIATKDFAKKINALGCDYLDAPVSGGEVGAKNATLSIMVGGDEAVFARAKPVFEPMGKNITLVGGNGDGQTCKVANQIVVALTIEAVAEAPAVRRQGRRRPGQGAPGADGRPGHLAHPGSAWRAHDQAHLRPGLPHRAAPEGPEPGAVQRARDRGVAAEHGQRAGAVQCLHGPWRQGLGPFGDGARARATGQLRDRPEAVNPQALLRRMFDAAIASAQPALVIPPHLPVAPQGRLIVIGAGKASAAMARAVEDHWAGPLEGLVVTRYGYAVACDRIEIVEAAHPVPDEAGLAAARRMLERVQGLTEDDLVLCLISGGGSSLLPLPIEGLTLAHKQDVNRALLKSGATIGEMNTVRRHLSAIKGGRLAAACHPARVLTLLISDVPGDDPIDIASGPTAPDPTTCDDALAIVRRYAIELPEAVREVLDSGRGESIKPGDPRLARSELRLIATPQAALEAAAAVAREAGMAAAHPGRRNRGRGQGRGQGAGRHRAAGRRAWPALPPALRAAQSAARRR